MKRFIWIGILSMMLVGMVEIISAQADSMSSTNTENANLTVKFSAPPVFDSVPTPVEPESPKLKVVFSPGTATATNQYPAQPAPAITPVPEPSTFMLIGIGILGLIALSRRKKG